MKNKTLLKLFTHILGLYLLFNFIYMMIVGSRHPFINFLALMPLWAQIILSCIYGVILYIIPGYLFVIAKQHREAIQRDYIKSLGLLAGLLAIIFIVSWLVVMFVYDKGPWVIYSIMNPVFGSLMYDVSEVNVSLFWFISVVIPSIGLGLGIKLRLLHEERNKK